jgi:chorismate mutase
MGERARTESPSGQEPPRDALQAEMRQLRDMIDRIDRTLVALLSERASCALTIGRVKQALQLEIYQPSREQQVLENVRAANRGPLDSEALVRLFERIIDEARRLERMATQADHGLAESGPSSDAPDARATFPEE